MKNNGESDRSGFFYVLQELGLRNLWNIFRSKLFSINHYYILKCNLKQLVDDGSKRIPAGVITLMGPDDLAIVKRQVGSLGASDRREVLSRIRFYERGFKNCYILKVNDEIAYLQWIIYPGENHIIKDYKRFQFLLLGDKQVLVENAYTFPSYRGRGIYNYVTIYLLNMAREQGYASAICYIIKERIIALNEFMKMGFKITKMFRESKMLGMVWRDL